MHIAQLLLYFWSINLFRIGSLKKSPKFQNYITQITYFLSYFRDTYEVSQNQYHVFGGFAVFSVYSLPDTLKRKAPRSRLGKRGLLINASGVSSPAAPHESEAAHETDMYFLNAQCVSLALVLQPV